MLDEKKLECRLIDVFNYSIEKRDYEIVAGNHSASEYYRGHANALSHILEIIREIKYL